MDFYEQFSFPEKTQRTKLAVLFTLKSRTNVPKRDLTVAFDSRHPLTEGFSVQYAYWLVFRKDGRAGDHYHKKKKEIFIPLGGSLSVELKDPKTGKKETLKIKASENHALYIPAGINHSVMAEEDGSILLVLANTPATEEDTYRIK